MMERGRKRLAQPSELPQLAFESMTRAVVDLADPWRTPVLATVHDNQPSARTVVIRSVDASMRTIWCFSDLETEKVAAIRHNSLVAWCLYDSANRIQLRLEGRATIETGAGQAETFWQTL